MARTILYEYKKQHKTLQFSYEKFRSIHEAVAAEEGIDISEYLNMEQQIEAVSDTKAVRDYRDNYFKKLGFGKITLAKKENKGVGKK